jgi:uncharacterized protein involved in high-affinity Fe2+ transport
MFTIDRRRAPFRRAAALAVVAAAALLAAGCGAASAGSSKSSTAGMSSSSSSDGMSGMDMGATPDPTGSAASAGGITAVPTQVLGTAVWQGMKITADAMTPVPFLIYNGTSMQEVKPAKNASFHLMVLLNDAQTNVVIPYASVWATITQDGKTTYDESLWPMISRYMGPHYGNDVALPAAGTYQLTLLISPPVSARHIEYQDVWLTAHKVTFTFHWTPVK